jgi:hypothetical protein
MSSPTVLQSKAFQALRQSPHPAVRRLAVEETEDAVVLTGRVSSYYLKQIAQETVMPVREGKKLLNRVRVER